MPRWRPAPMPSASSFIRPACATSARSGRPNWWRGCRPLSRRSACSSMPRRQRCWRPVRRCRSMCCSSTAMRTPLIASNSRAPWLKAARVRPGLNLLEFARSFAATRGLLLDAFVEGYGGGGHVFDWTLIPPDLPGHLILSGGLTVDNVGDAVARVRPAAVDVSLRRRSEQGHQGSPENGGLRRCRQGSRVDGRLGSRGARAAGAGLQTQREKMRKSAGGITRTCWRRHLANHP